MKKIWLPSAVILLIVALDQGFKLWISHSFSTTPVKPIIPYVLEFAYLHNDGAAMGMLSGSRWYLIIFTLLLLSGCIIYLILGKHHTKLGFWSLICIVAGGIGNLIDRIALGYVIDFMRFPISWFSYSFNVADCAVCIGCGLLILDLLIEIFKKQPINDCGE